MDYEVKQIGAGEARKGDTILVDGAPCKIMNIDISKTGKHGHAKARIEAVGILDDKKRIFIASSHDKLEVPLVEKKNAQVLAVTGSHANVMDAETYENFDLEIPEELQGQVVEGIQVLYWELLGKKIMKQVRAQQ